jgi:hypothetical protein
MGSANGVEELVSGSAFVDVSSRRTIAVSGSQALEWLNDLVSAGLDDLAPGRSRPSLLLSPTGAVLAAFTVALVGGSIVLIQDPRQPRSIAGLLEPYVLSSDVRLDDRTGELAIFAFPGRTDVPDAPGADPSAPSCLGVGADVISVAEEHDRVLASLSAAASRASDDDAEAWRVAAAIPAVGVDTAEGDLPAECRLEEAVSFDKGCYLGQEAVARTRNLGHPRRLLVAVEGDGAVAPGDVVHAGDGETGSVTSTARVDGRTLALARIRWEHRDAPLRTAAGVELRPRLPLG